MTVPIPHTSHVDHFGGLDIIAQIYYNKASNPVQIHIRDKDLIFHLFDGNGVYIDSRCGMGGHSVRFEDEKERDLAKLYKNMRWSVYQTKTEKKANGLLKQTMRDFITNDVFRPQRLQAKPEKKEAINAVLKALKLQLVLN